MVGGERVNDRELKEKRLKKKRAAEQRLNALAKIIAKVEDEESPHLVLKVYDDIQEELRAKTELLRKTKQRVSIFHLFFKSIFPPKKTWNDCMKLMLSLLSRSKCWIEKSKIYKVNLKMNEQIIWKRYEGKNVK